MKKEGGKGGGEGKKKKDRFLFACLTAANAEK